MAITAQTPYNSFTGNGTTTDFTYTFRVFESTDMAVYLDNVLQVSGYTVGGVGSDSGTVAFAVAPANGVIVLLKRDVPYNRLVDYQTGGDLLANTLDSDIDRVVAQIQQLQQMYIDCVRALVPGGNYDAGARRIINMADPVDAQDAMTYASALASVTSCATDAATATTQAGIATTKAGEAAGWAAAAAASASVLADGDKGDIVVSGSGLSWAVKGTFHKSDTTSVAFTKTAAGAISIKAGTRIVVAGTLVSIATDTAVVMPTLAAGTDYAIYACTDGTVRADASFTAPTGYTTANSRMIGGFHYGLVAAGTTVAGGSFATTGSGMIWTQADVDKIAGINQYSIWDLKWRPQCDPRGMALVAGRTWVDIYFCGTNHIANGTSKAGTDIASGTVLPKIPLEFGGNGTATYSAPTWWDFSEIVNSHKKRLLREQEFVLAAYGVTENQSIDATQSTYPTTQRNAGYTSKYGLEQATGHHWTWGEDSAGSASAYVSNGGRGQSYNNSIVRVLFGGSRADGAYSGSRCSVWGNVPANVGWSIGVRAACDHLILL